MRRQFIKETTLPAKAADVFDWHTKPEAFSKLIPPWEPVRLVELTGPISEEGSLAILEIKLLKFLPLRWVSRHQNYTEGSMFQDIQTQGPFQYWLHTHRVLPTSTENTCLLQDDITYELPLGLLGDLFGSTIVHNKLTKLFDYRHQTMLKIFSSST